MKRIRKIFALAVAFVMILGMTITAAAAEAGATITINGADNAEHIWYSQIIKPDRTTPTGWAIVDGFETAFEDFAGSNDQEKLQSFIDCTSETQIAEAMKKITATTGCGTTINVTEAGLYLINASETGYDYNPMLAYIGFDENYALKNTSVTAKKIKKIVGKVVESGGETIEVGDEVSYTLTAQIPYKPIDSDEKFIIVDELKGGRYKVENNQVAVTVGTETKYFTPETTTDGQKLTMDLTYLTEGNTKANQPITITYTIQVLEVTVENTAYPLGYKENATPVKIFAGTITITKMNEAGSNNPEYLSGAEFVIMNAADKYAQLDENGVLVAWLDEGDANITKLTTVGNGKVTAKGFDGNKTYRVKEVKAPNGYTLNDDPVTVDWAAWDYATATTGPEGSAIVHDTKLSQLPFTGGSGTAAFTGFGVLLMSAAAGLYFANKKNNSTK